MGHRRNRSFNSLEEMPSPAPHLRLLTTTRQCREVLLLQSRGGAHARLWIVYKQRADDLQKLPVRRAQSCLTKV